MNSNDKIMVRIMLPVRNLSFDVRLPEDLMVKDAVPTIVEILKKVAGDELLLSGKNILCKSDSGEILSSPDMRLKDLGIKDADMLYLV